MKVTRSYWLGLGSGLILSAILTLIFSPQKGTSDIQSVNPQETISQTGETKHSDPPPIQSSESIPKENSQANVQISTNVEQDFVIPKGASAETIADLLFAQSLIKDKVAFLELTHKMGAERQFRAGTFRLSLGLTEDELIHRLLK